jgi:L-aspartate oxidase
MTMTFSRNEDRVVIIGSGIAGLVTALMLAPQPVLLITIGTLGSESSSKWAQGGIAASLSDDDDLELHVADTLAAGGGLCDAKAARAILGEAPEAIAALEGFGVRFDRNDAGEFQFGLEAAHSRRRILHAAGDSSGAAIVAALINQVRNCASIKLLEGVEVRRLLVEDNQIKGVLGVKSGNPIALSASRVVLATGGVGGLYEASTNPSANYGHGVMLAARAGAVLADMEFVQFHPTALEGPRRPLALISEAVRGEGAVLVNEAGDRFLANIPGAELATRDVVANAIGAEIAHGRRVFLDARDALGNRFQSRFPQIYGLCIKAGIDPSREMIPVRPAAHYHMGGVATDILGRSSVTGLWVVGETACTGLHGANRLASNSLIEATVMAMRAARSLRGTSARPTTTDTLPDLPSSIELTRVRELVSENVSIIRNALGLERAITRLLPLALSGSSSSDPAIVALSVAVFAWLRNESRGAHMRSDFSQANSKAMRQRMNLDEVLKTAQSVAMRHLACSA